MPGIAGIIGRSGTLNIQSTLSHMVQSSKEKDWYTTDSLVDKQASTGIAVVELGIINRTTQPATDKTKATYVFLYGDIYGSRNGFQSTTHALHDANSILTAYREKGELFVQDMIGDFSIVLYDKIRKKVFIMSDRYGRRPLYYSVNKHYLGFSSEIKAILSIPGFNKSVDQESIAEMLSFGYVLGNRTLLSNVNLLPPGSILEYDLETQQYEVSSHWRLADNLVPLQASNEELLERIADSFNSAVNRMLVADRVTGISLSGGLDSRAVMAVINTKDYPVRTITTGIPGGYESGITRQIAEIAGCEHSFYPTRNETLSGESQLELIKEAISLTDGMRGSSFNAVTVFTARNARSHGMDILVTGHAGEVAKLDHAYNFSLAGRLPARWTEESFYDWCLSRMTRPICRGMNFDRLFSNSFADTYRQAPADNLREITRQIDPDLPIEQKVSYMFINELFRKRAMYAMGIQRAYTVLRLPFLDDEFLNVVLRAPLGIRSNSAIHMHIMRKYCPRLLDVPLSQTRVPPGAGRLKQRLYGGTYTLLRRLGHFKKDVPEDYLQARGDADYFDRILLDERTLDRGLVNGKHLSDVLASHRQGNKRPFHMLHLLAGVELWYRMFIDDIE